MFQQAALVLVPIGLCVAWACLVFWWNRGDSMPRQQPDIRECVYGIRRRTRKPKWRRSRPYLPYPHPEQLEPHPEIAAHVKSLQSEALFEKVHELIFSSWKLEEAYGQYFSREIDRKSWGAKAHMHPKPALAGLGFRLGGRSFNLERFMGDPERDDDGVVLYGYEECTIKIDGKVAFRACSFADKADPFKGSVAIYESHIDQSNIDDLNAVVGFVDHHLAVEDAKSRRRELATKNTREASKAAERAAQAAEQRDAFAPWESKRR